MKTPILAGALAAVFWGTVANAQSSTSQESLPPPGSSVSEPCPMMQSPPSSPTTPGASGGSGMTGSETSANVSGQPPSTSGNVTVTCAPCPACPSATGGSEQVSKRARHHGKEGEGYGGAGMEETRTEKHMRGVGASVGAGIEGFSGGLAPQISPGPTYGATVALRPSRVMGLEVGYSGSTHEIPRGGGGRGLVSGPDMVRNGGQAVATLGLGATPVQPYVLGGYGISRYNVRGGARSAELGYRSDTASNIPVGGGVRAQMGPVTADARVNYNFLVGENFASHVNRLGNTQVSQGGQYQGTLNLGATF